MQLNRLGTEVPDDVPSLDDHRPSVDHHHRETLTSILVTSLSPVKRHTHPTADAPVREIAPSATVTASFESDVA